MFEDEEAEAAAQKQQQRWFSREPYRGRKKNAACVACVEEEEDVVEYCLRVKKRALFLSTNHRCSDLRQTSKLLKEERIFRRNYLEIEKFEKKSKES